MPSTGPGSSATPDTDPDSPAARTDGRPAYAPVAVNRPVLAAVLMTTAALLFAVINGLVRYAADLGYHPFQIAFLRSAFALLIMGPVILPVVRREGVRWLKTTRPGLFLARGLAATAAIILWMTALATMPMAEATAISFTSPLFATVGSALLLHERVRARRWTAIAVGFAGVLIILRPGVVAPEPGAFAALAAALGMATAVLLIKALTRTEPMQRIVLYTSLVLTAGTAIPAVLVWQPLTPLMWAVAVGLGGVGALNHMVITKAFESAEASVVIPFDYTRLPFAAVVGAVFFAQTTDMLTWAGALVIAGAAFYVARREHQISRGAGPPPRDASAT